MDVFKMDKTDKAGKKGKTDKKRKVDKSCLSRMLKSFEGRAGQTKHIN